MSKRRNIFIISGAAVVLVIVAALAIWFMAGGRTTIGETDSELGSTAQAPLPPIIATIGPTDMGASGGTPTPGAFATPPILGTYQTKQDTLQLDPPPSLKELIAKYPKLNELLRNLNLTDQKKLEAVYQQLLVVYQGEGLEGLYVIVAETGILEALNLDSAYFDFIVAYEGGGIEKAEELARKRGLINEQDELRLIVILDTEDASVLEPLLSEMGGRVIRQHKNNVEVGIPLQKIKEMGSSKETLFKLVELSHLEHVVGIQAPEVTKPNDILFDEGPGVTGADLWHQAGITGQGMRIGIIDPDGFYGYLDLLGTKLPEAEHVFVYPDDPQGLSTQTGRHGSACAEVVHEMAPDADLYLAYSGGTGEGLGNAIDWMLENGVKIVSYSATNLTGPKDGTGPVTDLVRKATDAGILWVNSSGNYAQTHLKMQFTDEDNDGWHEFPDGDEIMRIYPVEGGTILALSWDDVFYSATENYDIFVLTPKADGAGYEEVVSERSPQSGRAADHPFEVIYYEFTEEREYYLAIQAINVTRPAQFNLLADRVQFPYWMVDSSLGSPADANEVLSVGATFWQDDSLEPYSSQGPTDDGRIKPDISAPAGVTSATYGEFYGTSASAPHVAGAAALVWSAYPDASAAEVRDYLLQFALDMGDAGADNRYGAGRLALPAPPTPGAKQAPSGPPSFTIKDVWQEHNILVSGIKGMKIHVSFETQNFQDQPGTVLSTFFDESGDPLKESNGAYSVDGQVAVWEGFRPRYEPTIYSDFTLFMPYNELELGEGSYDLKFQVTIRDDNSGQALANSDFITFSLEQGTLNPPAATLTDVQIEHNVVVDGLNGLMITISFDVTNLRNQEGEVAAYFYFDDAGNRRLKDYNGYYRDPNGFVAVGMSFKTGSNDATIEEMTLFLPYRELHIYEEEHYDLKFHLVIWDKQTGTSLANSDWVKFWFEP